jgi:hypothetical protein
MERFEKQSQSFQLDGLEEMESNFAGMLHDLCRSSERNNDDKRSGTNQPKLPRKRREFSTFILANLVMEFGGCSSAAVRFAPHGELWCKAKLHGRSLLAGNPSGV